MKKKTIVNIIIVGSMILIAYIFAGHGFVKFYFGGKTEMLEAAAQINRQCDTDGECPAALKDWQARGTDNSILFKGDLLYFVSSEEVNEVDGKTRKHQTFRLVYRFFMPDDWFEVQGGVGKEIISGWKKRQ